MKNTILLLQLVIFTTVILQVFAGTKCKWSNEDCSGDSECCSGICSQAHPGTNHRCKQNPMNYSCIYDYHCADPLVCGGHQRCCAAEWGDCMKNWHCCDPNHNCIEVKGFIYKRCLVGKSVRTSTLSIAAITHCLALSIAERLRGYQHGALLLEYCYRFFGEPRRYEKIQTLHAVKR